MFWIALLGTFLAFLTAYLVNYAKVKNRYWQDQGIPHVKPYLFIGNYLDVLLKKKTNGELVREICHAFPHEPLVGYFIFTTPVLIVNDLSQIERVLVKDFNHFVDHGFVPVDREAFPYHKNLFTETGKKWRAVRYKMSSMFTSGRLKSMTAGMVERSEIIVKLIEDQAKSGYNKICLTEALIKMDFDMFGSCGFGINAIHSGGEELSEFRQKAPSAVSSDWLAPIKNLMILGFPRVAKKLGITFFSKSAIDYFTGLIKRSMDYREKENFVRNDFAQMLMALKEKGFVEMTVKDSSDDYLRMDSDAYLKESYDLTFEELLGHAFTFMVSGVEPPAVVITIIAHELGLNPKLQEDVREEIMRCVDENNGVLDYKSLKSMNYLEMCVKESLRKHPIAEIIFRGCTKEYTFPGTGYTSKPGDIIHIPTLAVHYNPELYENPDSFIPERFSPDNKMPPCSYLAFSEGPRMCIGMRLAIVLIKIGMAQLLLNYRIKPHSKKAEIRLRPLAFDPHLRNEVFFNLQKL